MESRASARLGENVKLLTLVSIFFLPLSFCTSVWSINNTIFSLKALLVVVILVGLTTYLIVFNLNNLVGFCGRIYCSYKTKLIQQMKNEPGSGWKEKGRQFSIFRPRSEIRKPSEWIIGLFILRKLFRTFSISPRRMIHRKPQKEQTEVNTSIESVLDGPDLPFLQEGVPSTSIEEARNVNTTKTSTRLPLGERLTRLRKAFRRGPSSADPMAVV
ncbi:hypothetical protein N431DRAFT_108587 [Stipitochalara longipes BDJ]|nr:hypothetical protein N431DRAFT_108587 [Stipitochalara longipes BDJ]